MKKNLAVFIYSILAGFCIGIGGTVFLRLKDAFPGGNVVGALLFAIGLFAVCTRGYALYTGRVCALFENPPSYVGTVVLIWIGNFCGTLLIGCMERATGLCGGSGIDAAAAVLVQSKLSSSYLSLFLLGILCNILIYLAVNGYAKNPHEIGKYLAILLGVSVFILCGTEHSVADMYYWSVSGVLFEQPLQSLACLGVITLGNAVGGVAFPLLEKAYRRLTA